MSTVNLRHFIGCAVREFTFQAKKPGCGGLHVTTDACWGRCETWEVSEDGGMIQTGSGSVQGGPVWYQSTVSKISCKCICCLQKPVLESPFIESYQRVCTYNLTRLVTVKLPNCKPSVDPTYTYPVALRCSCGVCLTSTTECITSVWKLGITSVWKLGFSLRLAVNIFIQWSWINKQKSYFKCLHLTAEVNQQQTAEKSVQKAV